MASTMRLVIRSAASTLLGDVAARSGARGDVRREASAAALTHGLLFAGEARASELGVQLVHLLITGEVASVGLA